MAANTALPQPVHVGEPPKLDDPTLREHSKLQQHNPPGRPLAEIVAQGRIAVSQQNETWKGMQVIRFDPPGSFGLLSDPAIVELYRYRACAADIVVVGTPTAQRVSHVAAGEAAVYTDYCSRLKAL